MARKFDYSTERLLRAWKDARTADAYARERRREIVREYVGPHWNEQGADCDIPLNLLSLYVQVVSRSLIPKEPRFLLSTFDAQHRAAVNAVEAWGNRELRLMKAGVTARRVVIDALFGVGIGRVALATPADAANRAWGPRGGEPIFTRIDREDFAYDSFAGDFTECAWLAHKYRVPLKAVQESKAFRRTRKDLQGTRPQMYDEFGVEQIGVLGRSFYGHEEFEEMVELWEFYAPRHRAVLTFQTDGAGNPVVSQDGKPLGEQPWVGPASGPYHVLGYQWVPGNCMPKGPLMDLFDPHEAANQFYRKSIAATARTKEITVYRNEEDAKRVAQTSDGETTFVENPNEVQNVVYGGQHVQAVYGAAQAMRELFDFMGGNLSVLGGRGQSAKTATQEVLLNQNAQGSIADMADSTGRFMNEVVGSLCWYWWKHPHAVMESGFQVRGVPEEGGMRQVFPRNAVDQAGRPRGLRRQADFETIDVRVDEYSLTPATPSQRLQLLRDVWRNEVIPVMPLLQQQGIMADYHGYFEKIGKYLDDPDFMELLTVQEPPADPTGGGSVDGQGQPPMPGNTERTYNRVSTSEATEQGQGKSMITQLMSGKSQGGAQERPSPFAGVGA